MSTTREKKLNKSDVRIGIWKFILSFAVLSVVSFTCLFLFFKSYSIQREGITKEAQDYKDLMVRSDLMKDHVEKIYELMNQLNIDKVQNGTFLRTKIMDDVADVKLLMKGDSTSNFKHYAVLMKQIEPMLKLKDDILEVEYNKRIVRRDLEECMSKVDRANNQLKKDPTRNFTGGKRR
ncbi:type VI secretion system transmembrane protein TssO [Chryseobacterium sp. RP-3-3]|uniref:Type VI secretion system transmembrane protein TssO n=1 Tax=Chryseobacterium antibioticum TaxID=2728847 RepID=A0A7Y0FSR9_9FLAO|nr:type VI secretion system TssO [Chryseobacterium antibioticum]NML71070.1 type VI secretion system transmembrane protein TssO [Chryseobacterium antibioticum]